ncbi:MAG: universal stress protein [Tetrasphaera sp.]
MTVVVAHQASEISAKVLAEAVREAAFREVELVILNVTGDLDMDKNQALEVGIGDVVDEVKGDHEISWRVHVAPLAHDVAHTVLSTAADLGAELLIIGARQRSPVGKALMGSIAQDLILESPIPVLVVKR